MYLLPSGFHRPRLSDTHARSTGSEKTIFTFWIPPWNWKVRASLQISGLLPKYLTDDNRNLIRAIEIRVFKLRNIWVCIVELFFLLHSLRDAGPRQQFGKHVSRLPDVASDTSANFLFTSFLQASRETPWLRAAVSLHHSPVWAWCHGEQTASHGDCYWGPHHPHPSHLWGYSYKSSLLSRLRIVGGERGGGAAAAVQRLVFLLFYFSSAFGNLCWHTHTAVCLSCSTMLPLSGRELLWGVRLHLVAFLSFSSLSVAWWGEQGRAAGWG